ncbi:helix-turn-helix transcriptional regulator [Fulvivirga ulvae]|uniref:winged helix-turn-helix transcriptional regulator n=1 Tax=Fulvivirga ulvae TaxID=2904245 RepID=UPI001F3B884B|nr:helix-turn-helix domain-containing protein [Fulvivirga ulvae]UII30092.1 helix-turn-helix transcriptional regulator [Fulvivirga ulvae]
MKKVEIKCPIDYSIALLGGKWTLPIIYVLTKDSPKRFKVLEREVNGITPTMLTSRLRALEEEKLVYRKIYPTIPPTVEYGLTENAEKLKPVINELEKFGLFHQGLMK